jgi:hypothetical protein
MTNTSHLAKPFKVSVKILRSLHPHVQLNVVQSKFNSVTDFVMAVLCDLVASATHNPEVFWRKDARESVCRPLHALGFWLWGNAGARLACCPLLVWGGPA